MEHLSQASERAQRRAAIVERSALPLAVSADKRYMEHLSKAAKRAQRRAAIVERSATDQSRRFHFCDRASECSKV
jgi:hypothetical protein